MAIALLSLRRVYYLQIRKGRRRLSSASVKRNWNIKSRWLFTVVIASDNNQNVHCTSSSRFEILKYHRAASSCATDFVRFNNNATTLHGSWYCNNTIKYRDCLTITSALPWWFILKYPILKRLFVWWKNATIFCFGLALKFFLCLFPIHHWLERIARIFPQIFTPSTTFTSNYVLMKSWKVLC